MAALRSPDDDDFSVLWDRLETLPFSWRAVPVGAWEHAVEHYAKQFEAQLATVAETVPSLDVHEEVAKELDRIGARVVSRLQSVAPVFQCMRAYAFGEPLGPEGLALRSGKLDETLLAQLAEAERNLLRARADHDQWPGGAQLEAQARTRKREPACAALWREAGSWLGYRQDVLDAPILAAILAVENVAPPRALMQDFRRIAEFDRQWFEDAQRSAFLYAYGRYLAKVMEGESESADG